MSNRVTPPVPPRERSRRASARRVLLDLTPLRLDRDYRWWWVGQTVSATGNQITRAAIRYQIYIVTGSILAIGLLTLAQFLGVVVFSTIAGPLADRFDRRRLLLVAQVGMAASTIALLLLAVTLAPEPMAIYALGFVGAGLAAADHALRLAVVPRLVPMERLRAAIALNQLNQKGAAILGPALAGVLIAGLGVPGAYGADALSFGVSIAAILQIAPIPRPERAPGEGLLGLLDGYRFILRRRIVLGAFASNVFASILAVPTALYAPLALDVFHVGPSGFGLLSSATAFGSFAGALMSGWISTIHRTGRAALASMALWGLLITGFGLATSSYWIALVLLAFAGWADVVASVLRLTIIQFDVPDAIRGRVISVYSMSSLGATRLGDLEATIVASFIGPQAAVVVGGFLCVGSVIWMARAIPEFRNHSRLDLSTD